MKMRPSVATRRGRRLQGATSEDWKRPLVVPNPMEVKPELHRRLKNWSQWRSGGLSIGMAVAYESLDSVFRGSEQLSEEARPKPIPVITAEAEEMDRVIKAMPRAWCVVLIAWWCKGGSIKAKAEMCGCRKETMLQRLALAHQALERTFS